ncbi:MAG: DUF1273 domain-containing protein [Clostridia bacterium]|nr:DUF1273 domain-containing protein [Clostridia bacterium]
MLPKICAFTGHRPSRIPGGHNEKSAAFRRLCTAIEAALRQAVAEGYTVFRSGGAMGFDLWCAEAVLRIQKERAPIQLHFLLPCETQANAWPACWRERYFDALANADKVTYVQARYSAGCMFRRNRALVHGAHLMIAYFDGKARGGTAYTVSHAKKEGLPVWNLFKNANQA